MWFYKCAININVFGQPMWAAATVGSATKQFSNIGKNMGKMGLNLTRCLSFAAQQQASGERKGATSMYEQFRARAETVGAEVYRFKTSDEALDFVLQFIRKEGIQDAPQTCAVWADGPFLNGFDREQLSQMTPGLRFDVGRDKAAAARIGISEVGFAVTDTGSLVADQTDVSQRLVSTLPTIHIALIGTDRILPDKAALFTRINPATSRYIAFITGPSRTADIERVLTIGVHGPKRLVIVFVDGMGGVSA